MSQSSPQPKTVIFVCTGNYYRSRFSEHVFNALAERHGLLWQATSRGLQTWLVYGHGPISVYTLRRLKALGMPVEGEPREPRQLTLEDLETADLVVAVKESEHRPMMLDQFPEWADRIEYWHIDDLDCATPEESLPLCEAHLEALVERLADAAGKAPRPAALRKAG